MENPNLPESFKRFRKSLKEEKKPLLEKPTLEKGLKNSYKRLDSSGNLEVSLPGALFTKTLSLKTRGTGRGRDNKMPKVSKGRRERSQRLEDT